MGSNVKKHVIALGVLLGLVLAGSVVIAIILNNNNRAFDVTSHYLYGDPAYAEGLTVTTRLHTKDEQYSWESTINAAAEGTTMFTAHNFAKKTESPVIWANPDISFGEYLYTTRAALNKNEEFGYDYIWNEVFLDTVDKNTCLEVQMSEYLEFFPYDIRLNGCTITDTNYLRIPMYEDVVEYVTFDVTKGEWRTSIRVEDCYYTSESRKYGFEAYSDGVGFVGVTGKVPIVDSDVESEEGTCYTPDTSKRGNVAILPSEVKAPGYETDHVWLYAITTEDGQLLPYPKLVFHRDKGYIVDVRYENGAIFVVYQVDDEMFLEAYDYNQLPSVNGTTELYDVKEYYEGKKIIDTYSANRLDYLCKGDGALLYSDGHNNILVDTSDINAPRYFVVDWSKMDTDKAENNNPGFGQQGIDFRIVKRDDKYGITFASYSQWYGNNKYRRLYSLGMMVVDDSGELLYGGLYDINHFYYPIGVETEVTGISW